VYATANTIAPAPIHSHDGIITAFISGAAAAPISAQTPTYIRTTAAIGAGRRVSRAKAAKKGTAVGAIIATIDAAMTIETPSVRRIRIWTVLADLITMRKEAGST
jgi:hypothetical protein